MHILEDHIASNEALGNRHPAVSVQQAEGYPFPQIQPKRAERNRP
jgi:hypothetical protein